MSEKLLHLRSADRTGPIAKIHVETSEGDQFCALAFLIQSISRCDRLLLYRLINDSFVFVADEIRHRYVNGCFVSNFAGHHVINWPAALCEAASRYRSYRTSPVGQ